MQWSCKNRNPKDSGRWVGLEIQSDALLRELVPRVIAELKQRGNGSMGALGLAVSENGRGTIFSSGPELVHFEATMLAGPTAPLWTLSGSFQGATFESLAQEQFRNRLALSGVLLCCIVLAIGLSMRVVSREAKLAELKSGFVSNVSHELKTPLSLIRVILSREHGVSTRHEGQRAGLDFDETHCGSARWTN